MNYPACSLRLRAGLFSLFGLLALIAWPGPVRAQEQSRESAVNDATAAQWSLQFAYQDMPSYRQRWCPTVSAESWKSARISADQRWPPSLGAGGRRFESGRPD